MLAVFMAQFLHFVSVARLMNATGSERRSAGASPAEPLLLNRVCEPH